MKIAIVLMVWLSLTIVFAVINERKVKQQIKNSENPKYTKRERTFVGGLRVDLTICVMVAGLITSAIFSIIHI